MKAVATYGFDWDIFEGSVPALRFARRDLETVQRVVGMLPERRVCLQAGGSLGIFPKYLAQQFESVITFEPSATNYAKMRANAPERNILMTQAALGYDRTPVHIAQKRRTKLHAPPHEGVAHIDGPGHVPVVRIDDLCLRVCDFLCLDLEGYEYDALRGAEATLARCRPVVMVEINDNCAHYGRTEDDVRGLLTQAGYRFVFKAHADEVFVPQERS